MIAVRKTMHDRSERLSRRLVPAVLVMTALMLAIGAASLPLFDPDEARFARTSLEMQRSGDLVVPTFEGEPRLVKPPLLHWLQATLFSILGTDEWVVRLPSIAATLAALLITGWVARRRFGEQGALWAMVCMATMPLVIVIGRQGTLDALLMLHVWAVVAYDLDSAPEGGTRPVWPYGLLLGLAFLIKGPVGVVLPLLMILAGRTAAGRTVAPSLRGVAIGIATWALVVLPRGLAFATRVGRSTAATLKEEVWLRFFEGTAHVEPFWYYLPVLPLVCLPWIAPFCFALFRVLRHARDPASRTARYLAAAFLAGFVLFSVSRGKIPNYILPLLPLMAMLLSWELARELELPRKRIRSASLLAATMGAFAIAFGVWGAGQLSGTLRAVAWAGAAVYGLATLGSFPALLRRRPLHVWILAAAAQAIVLFAVVGWVAPEVSRKRTTAWLIEAVPHLGQGRPVAMVDMKLPSLTWYLDRVPVEVDLAHLADALQRDAGHLYVFDTRDLERVPAEIQARLQPVGEQGKYRVFELGPVRPVPAQVDGVEPPG
jgi:4-amino-4-deoxy-L-arabinose transferase-like glycosyltransferase